MPCNQFLASPSLTQDKNRSVGVGYLFNLTQNLQERLTVTDDLTVRLPYADFLAQVYVFLLNTLFQPFDLLERFFPDLCRVPRRLRARGRHPAASGGAGLR